MNRNHSNKKKQKKKQNSNSELVNLQNKIQASRIRPTKISKLTKHR